MNIDLTGKEFRRLLDMVYIGNWILNSTRTTDRFEDYDLVQEKLFSLCAKTVCPRSCRHGTAMCSRPGPTRTAASMSDRRL